MNRPRPQARSHSRPPSGERGRLDRLRATRATRTVRTACVAALVTALATLTGATPAHAVDPPRVQCNPADARIGESSGLAPSSRHPGIAYTLNDSGNTPDVFAIDTSTCRTVAVLRVSGVTNTDWEAIAVGKDDAGAPAIFAADIGNNFGTRAQVTLYRIAEPATLADATLPATSFPLRFADGPHDAETAMIDPRDNRLYVASKLFGAPGSLYSAPLRLRTDQVNDLTAVGPAPDTATDGAFAPDGRSFAIRNYSDITVYAAPGQQLAKFASPSTTQGESLMYAPDGRSLYVGSEGANSPLWVVPLPPEAIPGGPSAVSVVSPGGQSGVVGRVVSLAVVVSGGSGPYTCVFQGLPVGLSAAGGGCVVSGSPSVSGTSQVSVTAADSVGAVSAPVSFGWTVAATPSGGVEIASPGARVSRFDQRVTVAVRVSGGTAPYSCVARDLPAGLFLSPFTCVVSGRAWGVGSFAVEVTATDAVGAKATAAFPWNVTWF